VKPWPYPFWTAHRGAGRLAPENTMAAFRLGAQHGYRMFECDAKLSADGIAFLMHDATLNRTTNAAQALGELASMVGGDHTWATLSQLDAGSWHSTIHAGEPLPTLQAVSRMCAANAHNLNIEIKPTPGSGPRTGVVIAAEVARYFALAAAPPLLTSFDHEALEGAAVVAPELARGLLLARLNDGWLEQALQLGCSAVVCDYSLWRSELVAVAHAAGMRCLSYTVNDEPTARWLIALGTDGIITDRIDLFSPDGR
jgi:glycerophosphoryl diester phosphodiesterase